MFTTSASSGARLTYCSTRSNATPRRHLHAEVVAYRQGPEDAPAFRDEAKAALGALAGGAPGHVVAADADLARHGAQQPGGGAEQRGLTCSVGAEERHDAALRHRTETSRSTAVRP